jgi:hypothetical protein
VDEGVDDASTSCFSTLCQSARQLSARPERNRFRVSFTPLGEIATVNGSPSISISRRISFKSFVAMPLYTPAAVEMFSFSKHVPRRSLRPGREDVLGVPFTAMLTKTGVTDETGFHQHNVRGLQNALKVRRIFLN